MRSRDLIRYSATVNVKTLSSRVFHHARGLIRYAALRTREAALLMGGSSDGGSPDGHLVRYAARALHLRTREAVHAVLRRSSAPPSLFRATRRRYAVVAPKLPLTPPAAPRPPAVRCRWRGGGEPVQDACGEAVRSVLRRRQPVRLAAGVLDRLACCGAGGTRFLGPHAGATQALARRAGQRKDRDAHRATAAARILPLPQLLM